MNTTIRCTRCGTVTTWTPYCPSCSAYLEFAGDPPWVPAPPKDTSETDAPDDASAPDAADSTSSPEPAPDTTSENTPTATPEPQQPAKPDKPPKPAKPSRPHRRFGGDDPWWRFWGKKKHAATAPAATPAAAAPEGPTTPTDVVADAYTYVVDAPPVPETVSAELPTRQEAAQKRTIPIGRPDDLGIPGGLPCPQCRFRNYVDASYCARCGYTLRDAVPPTQTLASALAPSEKPPRRTDWSFLAVVALVILILGIIFISPPGQPGRAFIGGVIRTVAYWIDPDLGTPVTFTSVTASSTGYGNPANSIVGDDLSSFWASAPGPSWGAGSTITFQLTEPSRLDRMVIRPGIQNGQFAVRALATPENLTLIFTELDSDATPSPSPSPTTTGSPTASPAASPTPAPSASPSGSLSPTPSPSVSASPIPTPTATPSVQASLNVIVEPQDYTSVVSFPIVYTDKVVLRIDSVYPPALPDVYAPGGGGQVAITAIDFMPPWSLGDLFKVDFRREGTPVPSPTPTTSPSASPNGSAAASPSATPSPSPTPSG